ncbi:hypothetical protein, partial [Brochothrix thermosphacta]
MVVINIKVSEIFLDENIFLERIIERLEKDTESVTSLLDIFTSSKVGLNNDKLIDNIENLKDNFDRKEILCYLR